MKIKIPINLWPAEFPGRFYVGVLGLVLTCAYPGRAASPPATAADTGRATIEGRFGKVEVDTIAPSLTQLWLRGANGLSDRSVLAVAPGPMPRPWPSGGYTYAIGPDERCYESRLAKPDRVDVGGEGRGMVVKITGVKLLAAAGEEPAAVEDRTLAAPGDGAQLVWTICRRWRKDFAGTLSGSPALFFRFAPSGSGGAGSNSVTSTLWCDSLRLDAVPSARYATVRNPGMFSENHVQTIRGRDTWAIYKLWTPWHAPADLRLEVKGGHLYRRGATFGLMNEVGAIVNREPAPPHREGETEEIALRISSSDRPATGYQLVMTLPDRTTETALKDFYGSLLNGGSVNDQKGLDLGNQSEGYYYAGSSWMYGMALAAGVPAKSPLATHPSDVARAFREHLSHILSTLDDQGRTHFGFNESGQFVDDNLHTLLGTHAYLLHSGDLAFVRQNLPALERMLGYFIQRRNARGLFAMESGGGHWYYDALPTCGVNAYYNAFFHKAAGDLAEMETACGRPEKAAEYTAVAQQIKASFNEVLWKENAPGGPRYVDWIDNAGHENTFFCDLCQWPAVAFGIPSPEQARKLVATADARIAQLEQEYGYPGFAGLSALWPAPGSAKETFGTYMNGGSLLSQTYWEILARARSGDHEGAVRRLTRFARRATETGWVGNNAANIKGEMGPGSGEPYLADMVVVAASAIQGVLGITPTWERLAVAPHLPVGWTHAEAEVLYKGRRHQVTVDNGQVDIRPREPIIAMPLSWTMDFNLRTGPNGTAVTRDVAFLNAWSGAIALQKADGGLLALWKLDETAGPVLDASPHRCQGTIAGQGVCRGEAGHVPASRAYRFDGHGGIGFPPDDNSLLIDPSQSFTAQCWFKTDAAGLRTMLFKYGAYRLAVNDGKLLAVLTDFERTQTAVGSGRAADGAWHHAAAVIDRPTQKLALYLDGKLDTPDGAPCAQNPVSIAGVGSQSRRPLSLGSDAGYGASFFLGSLDEVSLSRGALKPSEFSFLQDYAAPADRTMGAYVASGSYLSPPCDWGLTARLTETTIAADLEGGRVTATVEVSNDGFQTIASTAPIAVRDGVDTYPLAAWRGPARAVRMRFELTRGPDPARTPVVDGFRITAQPAP